MFAVTVKLSGMLHGVPMPSYVFSYLYVGAGLVVFASVLPIGLWLYAVRAEHEARP